MAHVAKFTKGTCGLLSRHYERYKNRENGEYVKYKNQDIHPELTHLNYNLAPEREQIPYLKKRLQEVHCLDRDNVNVMCDWVVTAPKELPEEHQREFFEVVYKHLSEKYGEKNVISAYVHMDETTPHMHFAFVPVVYDAKKDREKVSAKEALNRSQLKRFHPELQSVIDNWIDAKEYDFDCDVLNGATDGGNKTVEELKVKSVIEFREEQEERLDEVLKRSNAAWNEIGSLESRADKSRELQAEIEVLEKKRGNLKSEASELSALISGADDKAKALRKELNALQNDVEARRIDLEVLSSPNVLEYKTKARTNVISHIQGKDEVILDRADFNKLVKTAGLVDTIQAQLDKMAASQKKKMKAAADILEKAKAEARQIILGAKGESMKLRLDQAKDEVDLEKYKSLENKFPEAFKQMRDAVSHAKNKSLNKNHDEFMR